MKHLVECRRTYIATLALGCLTALGLHNNIDVSMALASVAIGLAAANAGENAARAKSAASTATGSFRE